MTEGPMQAAQRMMRPELPKRFWKETTLGDGEGGFVVLLDGRAARTPAKKVMAVADRGLGETLVAEWAAQGETLDPGAMPLTRLVSIAIDAVGPTPGPVRAEIVKYAGSDLLCYRAGEPEGLVENQSKAWDPVLAWARDSLGARFILAEGVMFAAQPEPALAAIATAVERLDGLELAAVQSMTTLTGSALLALSVAATRLSVEEAWAAAHVDEDWNIALWGEDEEAAACRASRFVEMRAAARVFT